MADPSSEVNNNAEMEQQLKEKLQEVHLHEASAKREAWAAKTPPPTVEVEEASESLYDAQILSSCPSVQYLSAKEPSLVIRPLQSDDFSRGYLELLQQLTTVGDVSESEFQERFMLMKSCKATYYNTVIVDTTSDRVIGAASLIVERKFIHKCANRGIIEEVIVSDLYRGKSLGKLIVNSLVELGKSIGCYKITLNCTDQMITFYERLGFVAEKGNANFLVIRVPN